MYGDCHSSSSVCLKGGGGGGGLGEVRYSPCSPPPVSAPVYDRAGLEGWAWFSERLL